MANTRNNFSGIIPIALLGIGVAYLLKGTSIGSAVKKLQFTNPKIKLGSLSWTSLKATVTIDVFNPTSTEIPVDFLSGNILYKGNNLTAFRVDGKSTGLKIKAHSTTPVLFELQISNFNAIETILDVVSNGVSTVLQVTGIAYAMGTDQPFSFAYDVVNQQLISNKPAISGKMAVNGISGVEAKLQFASNADMEKYFAGKKQYKKLMYLPSKN